MIKKILIHLRRSRKRERESTRENPLNGTGVTKVVADEITVEIDALNLT